MTTLRDRVRSLSPEKKALVLERLQQRRASASESAVISSMKGDRRTQPLSFAQQKLWFLDRLQARNAFYNVPAAVRLSGPLNIAALTASLQEIVGRHEVLRTNYAAAGDGHPRVLVGKYGPVVIPVTDASGVVEDKKAALAEDWMRKEASHPFDLEKDQLIRARLLKLRPEEHVLLVTMHHIVSDGWSKVLLLREMALCYEAIVNHHPPSLPALSIQYADYASWQSGVLEGESIAPEIAYWKQQLDGAPAALDLPFDRGAKALTEGSAAVSRHHFKLPARLRTELNALAR